MDPEVDCGTTSCMELEAVRPDDLERERDLDLPLLDPAAGPAKETC